MKRRGFIAATLAMLTLRRLPTVKAKLPVYRKYICLTDGTYVALNSEMYRCLTAGEHIRGSVLLVEENGKVYQARHTRTYSRLLGFSYNDSWTDESGVECVLVCKFEEAVSWPLKPIPYVEAPNAPIS